MTLQKGGLSISEYTLGQAETSLLCACFFPTTKQNKEQQENLLIPGDKYSS